MRCAFCRCRHSCGIRRSYLVEVMKICVEDGSSHHRTENLWKKQIGDRTKLISGGGMPGDVYP